MENQQQQLSEMAEKANKQIVEGFKRILPHIAGHKTAQDLIFEGIEELNNVIKGYQAAQEEMKQHAIQFLESIRDYERENGDRICNDERSSEELYNIFITK